jgi:hypothetical protein
MAELRASTVVWGMKMKAIFGLVSLILFAAASQTMARRGGGGGHGGGFDGGHSGALHKESDEATGLKLIDPLSK